VRTTLAGDTLLGCAAFCRQSPASSLARLLNQQSHCYWQRCLRWPLGSDTCPRKQIEACQLQLHLLTFCYPWCVHTAAIVFQISLVRAHCRYCFSNIPGACTLPLLLFKYPWCVHTAAIAFQISLVHAHCRYCFSNIPGACTLPLLFFKYPWCVHTAAIAFQISLVHAHCRLPHTHRVPRLVCWEPTARASPA
jgi:hypothetical protein